MSSGFQVLLNFYRLTFHQHPFGFLILQVILKLCQSRNTTTRPHLEHVNRFLHILRKSSQTAVYGEEYLPYHTVKRWKGEFKCGRKSLQHDPKEDSPSIYYSVRKVFELFFLRKPGGFQWSALAWGDLEPSYTCVSFLLPLNNVSWLYATFEWGSVWCSRRIFIVRKMKERFGFRVVLMHTGHAGLHKQWSRLHEHHNHWRRVLGVRVRPVNQIVPSFSLQWKSDESSKNYFTQMLLAINLRYWESGKIHACLGSK